MQRRETRSLDIRRSSFDRLYDRRRSLELSVRRYDEPWGAAEKADTRLKCGDGQIHHIHSQVISCWSPVLRDMINLYPTPHLLESTHGLAYLLHVEEDSAVWASALDMMYPVASQHLDWDMLERCLLLADKYDMSCVLQRISSSLLDPNRPYSMDPNKPNFALRWLALADRLQLPQVASHIQACLRPGLTELGGQPDAMSAVLAYAHEHLSKEQLLQLLQLTMLAANSSQQQQQPQQQPQLVFLPPQQSDVLQLQQQTISMALQGWIAQAQSNSSSPQLQQQQQRGWSGSAYNPAVSASCSGTSSPATGDSGGLYSDDASSGRGDAENAAGDNTMQDVDVDGALVVEQQRLAMCMSSGLFAPVAAAAAPQQITAPVAAAAAASPAVFKAAAPPVAAVTAACPVPRFPAGSATQAFSMAQAVQQPQRQPVPVFGAMQVDMRAPSFGFGVNAGSASIADWMRNSFPSQPEGMCT